jgi:diguanylate cyclase (GGDEF)-like protein
MDQSRRLSGWAATIRVFIDDLPGEESVIELANRLIRVIGESVDLDGHVLHTTPSIGISLYPEDGRDAQALIRNADTAMYHAKANGRATTNSSPSR